MLRVLTALIFALVLTAPASANQEYIGRPIVIGRSLTIHSKSLGEERRINVYLPPNYGDGRGRYPVIYLLDGGEAEDFHHITGLAQVGSGNGFARDVIIVGIENTDRKRDMTFPSQNPADVKLLPTSGGSARFRAFIADELKPWVAANYRTSGETAIMGESLAGLFVMETFLKQPDIFDHYISVSPSLWWDSQSLANEAAARLKSGAYAGKSLYLTTAGDDLEGAQTVADALKAGAPTGLKWWFDPMPEEHHISILHPAALHAFRWLFTAPAG